VYAIKIKKTPPLAGKCKPEKGVQREKRNQRWTRELVEKGVQREKRNQRWTRELVEKGVQKEKRNQRIFTKSSKRNQNPSRYYNSITNLMF
jgi:hypothetical protein